MVPKQSNVSQPPDTACSSITDEVTPLAHDDPWTDRKRRWEDSLQGVRQYGSTSTEDGRGSGWLFDRRRARPECCDRIAAAGRAARRRVCAGRSGGRRFPLDTILSLLGAGGVVARGER